MKKLQTASLMIALTLICLGARSQEATNDFYDDAETHNLAGTTQIELSGEIGNPGMTDISQFPLRSIVVKETRLSGDSNKFIGAYRYDGYSLYDILNKVVLQKKNAAEFPPIIDLYVKVENAKGEAVIFSWGELYYPIHRHEIIIATKVTRIVPSKTKDLWPLPTDVKVVAGHDLLTERNISNPVKITVLSANTVYAVNKELKPLFSPEILVKNGDNLLEKILPSKTAEPTLKYETIFYGRGRGIHSTTPFYGIPLKDKLSPFFKLNSELLRNGYFVVASIDGYRSVFTFSEIFNRNDQAEALLVEDPDNQDGGAFRIFPAADFFSDRAVKAISEIRMVSQ
jgi:hypothetical protein